MKKKGRESTAGISNKRFETEFKTHFKGLCFFAVQYVKDMDTAKEIVQDVFMALWEKRKSIDTNKSVKTYLSTSVRNKCLNYLRDNAKFNKDMLSFEGLETNAEVTSHDMYIRDELQEKINNAIAKLPEKCKKVFILNRMKQLKYKEIAVEMGISVKTVEVQMGKALKHMRSELTDYLTILFMAALIILKYL